MAERTVLVDDLDGTRHSPETPVRTVRLAVNDRAVRLDLTAVNLERLREALAPYLAVATRTDATERRPGYRSREDRERARATREWAAANGYTLAPGGRIPREVSDAYRAVHS